MQFSLGGNFLLRRYISVNNIIFIPIKGQIKDRGNYPKCSIHISHIRECTLSTTVEDGWGW